MSDTSPPAGEPPPGDAKKAEVAPPSTSSKSNASSTPLSTTAKVPVVKQATAKTGAVVNDLSKKYPWLKPSVHSPSVQKPLDDTPTTSKPVATVIKSPTQIPAWQQSSLQKQQRYGSQSILSRYKSSSSVGRLTPSGPLPQRNVIKVFPSRPPPASYQNPELVSVRRFASHPRLGGRDVIERRPNVTTPSLEVLQNVKQLEQVPANKSPQKAAATTPAILAKGPRKLQQQLQPKPDPDPDYEPDEEEVGAEEEERKVRLAVPPPPKLKPAAPAPFVPITTNERPSLLSEEMLRRFREAALYNQDKWKEAKPGDTRITIGEVLQSCRPPPRKQTKARAERPANERPTRPPPFDPFAPPPKKDPNAPTPEKKKRRNTKKKKEEADKAAEGASTAAKEGETASEATVPESAAEQQDVPCCSKDAAGTMDEGGGGGGAGFDDDHGGFDDGGMDFEPAADENAATAAAADSREHTVAGSIIDVETVSSPMKQLNLAKVKKEGGTVRVKKEPVILDEKMRELLTPSMNKLYEEEREAMEKERQKFEKEVIERISKEKDRLPVLPPVNTLLNLKNKPSELKAAMDRLVASMKDVGSKAAATTSSPTKPAGELTLHLNHMMDTMQKEVFLGAVRTEVYQAEGNMFEDSVQSYMARSTMLQLTEEDRKRGEQMVKMRKQEKERRRTVIAESRGVQQQRREPVVRYRVKKPPARRGTAKARARIKQLSRWPPPCTPPGSPPPTRGRTTASPAISTAGSREYTPERMPLPRTPPGSPPPEGEEPESGAAGDTTMTTMMESKTAAKRPEKKRMSVELDESFEDRCGGEGEGQEEEENEDEREREKKKYWDRELQKKRVMLLRQRNYDAALLTYKRGLEAARGRRFGLATTPLRRPNNDPHIAKMRSLLRRSHAEESTMRQEVEREEQRQEEEEEYDDMPTLQADAPVVEWDGEASAHDAPFQFPNRSIRVREHQERRGPSDLEKNPGLITSNDWHSMTVAMKRREEEERKKKEQEEIKVYPMTDERMQEDVEQVQRIFARIEQVMGRKELLETEKDLAVEMAVEKASILLASMEASIKADALIGEMPSEEMLEYTMGLKKYNIKATPASKGPDEKKEERRKSLEPTVIVLDEEEYEGTGEKKDEQSGLGTVEEGEKDTVEGGEKDTVGGGKAVTVGGAEKHTVDGGAKATVEGGEEEPMPTIDKADEGGQARDGGVEDTVDDDEAMPCIDKEDEVRRRDGGEEEDQEERKRMRILAAMNTRRQEDARRVVDRLSRLRRLSQHCSPSVQAMARTPLPTMQMERAERVLEMREKIVMAARMTMACRQKEEEVQRAAALRIAIKRRPEGEHRPKLLDIVQARAAADKERRKKEAAEVKRLSDAREWKRKVAEFQLKRNQNLDQEIEQRRREIERAQQAQYDEIQQQLEEEKRAVEEKVAIEKEKGISKAMIDKVRREVALEQQKLLRTKEEREQEKEREASERWFRELTEKREKIERKRQEERNEVMRTAQREALGGVVVGLREGEELQKKLPPPSDADAAPPSGKTAIVWKLRPVQQRVEMLVKEFYAHLREKKKTEGVEAVVAAAADEDAAIPADADSDDATKVIEDIEEEEGARAAEPSTSTALAEKEDPRRPDEMDAETRELYNQWLKDSKASRQVWLNTDVQVDRLELEEVEVPEGKEEEYEDTRPIKKREAIVERAEIPQKGRRREPPLKPYTDIKWKKVATPKTISSPLQTEKRRDEYQRLVKKKALGELTLQEEATLSSMIVASRNLQGIRARVDDSVPIEWSAPKRAGVKRRVLPPFRVIHRPRSIEEDVRQVMDRMMDEVCGKDSHPLPPVEVRREEPVVKVPPKPALPRIIARRLLRPATTISSSSTPSAPAVDADARAVLASIVSSVCAAAAEEKPAAGALAVSYRTGWIRPEMMQPTTMATTGRRVVKIIRKRPEPKKLDIQKDSSREKEDGPSGLEKGDDEGGEKRIDPEKGGEEMDEYASYVMADDEDDGEGEEERADERGELREIEGPLSLADCMKLIEEVDEGGTSELNAGGVMEKGRRKKRMVEEKKDEGVEKRVRPVWMATAVGEKEEKRGKESAVKVIRTSTTRKETFAKIVAEMKQSEKEVAEEEVENRDKEGGEAGPRIVKGPLTLAECIKLIDEMDNSGRDEEEMAFIEEKRMEERIKNREQIAARENQLNERMEDIVPMRKPTKEEKMKANQMDEFLKKQEKKRKADERWKTMEKELRRKKEREKAEELVPTSVGRLSASRGTLVNVAATLPQNPPAPPGTTTKGTLVNVAVAAQNPNARPATTTKSTLANFAAAVAQDPPARPGTTTKPLGWLDCLKILDEQGRRQTGESLDDMKAKWIRMEKDMGTKSKRARRAAAAIEQAEQRASKETVPKVARRFVIGRDGRKVFLKTREEMERREVQLALKGTMPALKKIIGTPFLPNAPPAAKKKVIVIKKPEDEKRGETRKRRLEELPAEEEGRMDDDLDHCGGGGMDDEVADEPVAPSPPKKKIVRIIRKEAMTPKSALANASADAMRRSMRGEITKELQATRHDEMEEMRTQLKQKISEELQVVKEKELGEMGKVMREEILEELRAEKERALEKTVSKNERIIKRQAEYMKMQKRLLGEVRDEMRKTFEKADSMSTLIQKTREAMIGECKDVEEYRAVVEARELLMNTMYEQSSEKMKATMAVEEARSKLFHGYKKKAVKRERILIKEVEHAKAQLDKMVREQMTSGLPKKAPKCAEVFSKAPRRSKNNRLAFLVEALKRMWGEGVEGDKEKEKEEVKVIVAELCRKWDIERVMDVQQDREFCREHDIGYRTRIEMKKFLANLDMDIFCSQRQFDKLRRELGECDGTEMPDEMRPKRKSKKQRELEKEMARNPREISLGRSGAEDNDDGSDVEIEDLIIDEDYEIRGPNASRLTDGGGETSGAERERVERRYNMDRFSNVRMLTSDEDYVEESDPDQAGPSNRYMGLPVGYGVPAAAATVPPPSSHYLHAAPIMRPMQQLLPRLPQQQHHPVDARRGRGGARIRGGHQ